MEMEWIKVTDKLPEDKQCVIIANAKTKDVGEARYRKIGDMSYFEGINDIYSIANPMPTHWMPLPAPPVYIYNSLE